MAGLTFLFNALRSLPDASAGRRGLPISLAEGTPVRIHRLSEALVARDMSWMVTYPIEIVIKPCPFL